MEIKELVKGLEGSDEYRGWADKNRGFYIVHVFYMTGHPPQVGYYNDEVDKIITFDLGESIVINPASDVFKEKQRVRRLRLDNVSIDKPEASRIAVDFRKERYPSEIPDKEMLLLQEIGGRMVYNLTYFTRAFNTLNIKIDAGSGDIISHDLASLVSF